MNGHFAGVGDAPTKEQYEHGIQVIDEEKEFKYVAMHKQLAPANNSSVLTSTRIYNSPKSHNLALTTISSQSLDRSQPASQRCSTTCLAPNLV
jgi:hypothetical protein